MEETERRASIFIVYQGAETALAEKLQKLLKGWGYEAFQCRQKERDGREFREELRDNIRTFDLVVFLLSREFRWSPYCQAEAGTTMAIEKPFIPLLVPPVTNREMGDEIAPVLNGFICLKINDPSFISDFRKEIVAKLATSRKSLRELIARLQELDAAGIPVPAAVDLDVAERENDRRKDLSDAIKAIEMQYRLAPPKKDCISAWPSMKDEACKASIVGNIVEHLKLPGETNLTFVGVSLKFSLGFIAEALQRLVGRTDPLKPAKRLKISLIHMDDQSHILHALQDSRDMDAIKSRFGVNWQKTKETWKNLCGDAIKLEEPNIYRIDYIPPRVGILMETQGESTLYAGRCAFNQVDLDYSVYELDVGENEYIFHKFWRQPDGTEAPDPKALREFRASINAYRDSTNNSGVTPIWGSNHWRDRLERYIDSINGSTKVTFISGTGENFDSLAIKASERGAKVSAFVCDPGKQYRHPKFQELGLIEHWGSGIQRMTAVP